MTESDRGGLFDLLVEADPRLAPRIFNAKDPRRFLFDAAKFRNLKEELPELDPVQFSPEALARHPDMGWLSAVSCNLFHPFTHDAATQRQELARFRETLVAQATWVDASLMSAGLPSDYRRPVLALDTETTGLDLRIRYGLDGKLITRTKIVGVCLATSSSMGYYLPVRNTGSDGIPNWDPEVMAEFLTDLHRTFVILYHNAAYDREVCAQNGVAELPPFPAFFDTQILDFLFDVDNKAHGLKRCSQVLLGRKMVEIHELFMGIGTTAKKKDVQIFFDDLSASQSYVYGASDAMNTFGLFDFYRSLTGFKNPFTNQPIPIQIDHTLIDVIRDMLRPGFPVNLRYYFYAAKDTLARIELLREKIYETVGRKWDIGSPKQLSDILFNEFKIPPLPGQEIGKNKAYSTAEDVLDDLFKANPNFPILRYIVTYRKLQATLSKVYLKALANSFTDGVLPWARVQLDFSQTNVPTGRLSSSSSGGKERVTIKVSDKTGNITTKYERGTGDFGSNSQGIPSDNFIEKKARRIQALPPAAGVDLGQLYTDEVTFTFIQALAEL